MLIVPSLNVISNWNISECVGVVFFLLTYDLDMSLVPARGVGLPRLVLGG